jgi:uncharacterized membrane protein
VGPHIRRYRNDCSVEAIFLSTFILSSTQNRMAAAADGRAELDVQISLLAEAETAKLVELISDIAEQLNVRRPNMRKSRK